MATIEQTLDPALQKQSGRAMPPSWALIRRDFIDELRRRRSFLLAMLVVGVCIVLVSLVWPRRDVRIQDMGRYARDMFGMFGVVHLIVATVLPPGLAALAFASERRQDTLDQLRLSLISTLGLVMAKLLASVGLVALLFVATLPTLGVQLMLVGVATGQVVSLAIMVLATAFMNAAIGLLCAVVFRRPLKALVMSYICVVLALGGWIYVAMLPFLLLYFVLGQQNAQAIYQFLENLVTRRVLGMLAQVMAKCLVGPYEAIWGSGGVMPSVVLAATGYRVAVGVLCILLTARILSRPEKPLRVPKERPIDDDAVLWERRHRFPYYLVDPLRRRELIADNANPVFARELRHGLGMRLHVAFRLFVGTAFVFGMLGFWWAWPGGGLNRYGETMQVGMLFIILLTILVVQVLATNVVTKEREQGHFGALRMTLLTPYEIFAGKVAAGLTTLTPFLCALVGAGIPLLILALVLGHGGAQALFFGFLTLLTCAWLSFCAAFFVSVCARTTAQSFVGGFLLNLLLYGGPPMSYLVLEALDSYMQQSEVQALWNSILSVSPLLSYANMNFRSPRSGGYHSNSEVGMDIFFVLAIAVAVGFVLLALAYQYLQMLNERDE